MENKKGISSLVATLILILLTIVLIGIVWVIVTNIVNNPINQNNNSTNITPNICIDAEPNYLLDCLVNGTDIQVQSSQQNLQSAETNYGCTINTTYVTFNVMYCSQPSNYTKYKISISNYTGN